MEGIRSKFREHISSARIFADKLKNDGRFEILAPVPLNLICFRYLANGEKSKEQLNEINKLLEKSINDSGKAYITHTKLNGKYTLRMCIGQTNVAQRHIDAFWELLKGKIDLI